MGNDMNRRITRIILIVGLLVVTLTQQTGLAQTPGTPDSSATENPLYYGALPWELADDAEEMVVHSVTDGDTVRLTYPNDDWYYNTRLIGIQAPEMDGPYTDEGCYGPEAKEFLVELLPAGAVVYAQQDVSDEDTNGRRLRHVFLIDEDTGEAYLVSEILVLGGFAEARAYPPDDLYDDILQEAEEQARNDDDGLWDACAA
jgi:micrococcal nuclease